MERPPSSSLMAQADFGRTALRGSNLLLANSYRLVVAGLILWVIAAHLPLAGPTTLLVLALLVGYALYVIVRFTIVPRIEGRFYTPQVQFWRAHLSMLCVTAALAALSWQGQSKMVWVLYIPALFLLSRYVHSQWSYLLAALGVAALTAGARWLELRAAGLAPLALASELAAYAGAILLPSFLIHYLARVDIVARQGVAARDRIVRVLLERVLLEHDGLAVWWAIQQAFQEAAGATRAQLFLYDHERGRLLPLIKGDEQYAKGEPLDLFADHPAAHACRQRAVYERCSGHNLLQMALPIFGQTEGQNHPLAVVVLEFQPPLPGNRAPRQFVADLLETIRPICIHADVRHRFPLLDQLDPSGVQRLAVDRVIDQALDTVVTTLGFTYATISLVDNDRAEIATVQGRNVPKEWIDEARHALDSDDIQADVVRTGKVVELCGWDPRLDRAIWEKYRHERYTRVLVPLGKLGTIEAGFLREQHSAIPELLKLVLTRYAQVVGVAVRNAQLYEREQRYTASLTRLAEAGAELQRNGRPWEEEQQRALLQQIASNAHEVLGADLVMLYPVRRNDPGLGEAIVAGEIAGEALHPLRNPNWPNNIVRHIADSQQPYFQTDAQDDELLTSVPGEGSARPGGAARTFTQRQQIASFAGVPLLVHGQLLGVLCVNYRSRHQFTRHDRQLLALFAQHAAAVLVSHQLVRAQERRRLESDLHDGVKTSMRGLILLSNAASELLQDDPASACELLHEIRGAAWGILSDVELILNDLATDTHHRQALPQLIAESIARLVDQKRKRVVLSCPSVLPVLPLPSTQTLLRVMREAIINAVEHAEATEICVTVSHSPTEFCLEVCDNGQGFDPAETSSKGHRGIQIMRERAAAASGLLSIASLRGSGTRLRLALPYQVEEEP
jgi:signal transduction histidine kinase